MVVVNNDLVIKLASLAKIAVKDEELDELKASMSNIIEMIQTLEEIPDAFDAREVGVDIQVEDLVKMDAAPLGPVCDLGFSPYIREGLFEIPEVMDEEST